MHVRAAWVIQGGRITRARIETYQECTGAQVLIGCDHLISKVDLSLPGLRRALRRARLATGGAR